MKILIIEDDAIIAQSLADELSKWNYQAVITEDFNNIVELFQSERPHLVLLDVNLPSFNGYHWCQEIRKLSNVPIIFLSSRTDSMDQVMAMQMGGDDYIEKPFNMPVLVSKVQAMLRRTYDFSVASPQLTVNGASLNIEAAALKFNNKDVDLTHTELQILAALFKQAGQFVSRNALIEACWESEHYIDDNTLAVNITRLRKKLSTVGLNDFIETKKNVGYRIKE